MPSVTPKLAARLSKRFAGFKLSDAVVKELAERIQVEGLEIGRFHPCIYGICVDYWTNKAPVLDPFWKRPGVARLEVFPYGIIDRDRWHVRVGFEVPELPNQQHGLGY